MSQDKEIKFWGKIKNIVGLNTDEEVASKPSFPSSGHAPTTSIEHLSEQVPDLFTSSPAPAARPSGPGPSMVVMEPKNFEDALAVVRELKQNRSVIVNLHLLDVEQSQRIVDFVSGATHALEGNQERINESIFIFAPSSVSISNASAWVSKYAEQESAWEMKL